MKRVALYVRVSTDEQAKRGLSLGAQREALYRYARQHGYIVAGVYEDAGISARKPYTKRPALLRLLEDCKAGLIDLILFIKLDRWFRNVSQYYKVQDILDSCGVRWAATEEDYETETASGRFKVNIMLSVAQDEADRDGERIRFVVEARKAKGLCLAGKVPFGIKCVNSRYVADPDKADAVRDMFDQYIKHQSVIYLKRYMSEAYGLNRAYKNITLYLQNRLYIGEAYGIPGILDPIVDRDTFDLANEILQKRSQRHSGSGGRNVYLFTSCIRCKECGAAMSPETNKGYKYYRCRTHTIDPSECPHHRRVREDVLEEYLLSEIEAIVRRHYIAAKAAAQKKKPSISPDKIRRKMDRLKELYINELIDMEDYKRDSAALQHQLDELTYTPPVNPPDLEKIRDGLNCYETMDLPSKKAFWASIIYQIHVDDNLSFFVTPR